ASRRVATAFVRERPLDPGRRTTLSLRRSLADDSRPLRKERLQSRRQRKHEHRAGNDPERHLEDIQVVSIKTAISPANGPAPATSNRMTTGRNGLLPWNRMKRSIIVAGAVPRGGRRISNLAIVE